MAHAPRNAFRETFLLEMPARNLEVIRSFGEVLLEYVFELSSAVRHYDADNTPLKRKALKAVLADLEYLDEYLDVLRSGGETEESGELRLDEATQQLRALLATAIEVLRLSLGLKRRPIETRSGRKETDSCKTE